MHRSPLANVASDSNDRIIQENITHVSYTRKTMTNIVKQRTVNTITATPIKITCSKTQQTAHGSTKSQQEVRIFTGRSYIVVLICWLRCRDFSLLFATSTTSIGSAMASPASTVFDARHKSQQQHPQYINQNVIFYILHYIQQTTRFIAVITNVTNAQWYAAVNAVALILNCHRRFQKPASCIKGTADSSIHYVKEAHKITIQTREHQKTASLKVFHMLHLIRLRHRRDSGHRCFALKRTCSVT